MNREDLQVVSKPRGKNKKLSICYIWYIWKSSLDIKGANKMQNLIRLFTASCVVALGREKCFC